MAKVFIEETTLTAIGDAIRGKDGTSDLIPVTEMSSRISAIPSGGGDSGIPEEAFHFSGDAANLFQNNWDWFIEMYGNKITTSALQSTASMFRYSKVTKIPFALNFSSNINMPYMFYTCTNLKSVPDMTVNPSSYFDMSNMFCDCKSIENPPYIYGAYPSNITSMFDGCYALRDIPVDYTDTWNCSRMQSYGYANVATVFCRCYSLRRFPSEFFKELVGNQSNYNCIYYNMMYECCAADEVRNIPVITDIALTSNAFYDTFRKCGRLKDVIFELDPATNAPYVVQWKSQTIDLTTAGYDDSYANNSDSYFLNNTKVLKYNSGITRDKHVKDDATYQALKNDPDWFTQYQSYSRYNHDSAVNTINSLPDTSAYGTNTIKFIGGCGSKTDGGAINTLTEAEIAVAAAKGWTVTM